MTDAVIINFNESIVVSISTTDDTIVLPQIEAGDGTITVIGDYAPVGVGGFTPYVWVAPSALASWLIPHNLGRKPQVTIIDGAGNVFVGEVQYLDENVVLITFSAPTLGSAVMI